MPEKLLGQVETVLSYEPDQDLKVAECADGMTGTPTPADVNHQAAVDS